MYNNGKIGVGILTYNRQDKFLRLLKQVLDVEYVDNVIVVKNKTIEYPDFDAFAHELNDIRYSFKCIPEDVGVGACKNAALQHMIDAKCDHIFLIEDDVLIKNVDVFKRYIDTAKAFKLGHLNFCGSFDNFTKKYLTPFVSTQQVDGCQLDLYKRLCGNFQYFTCEALLKVGLIDAKSYVNVLEHAEHSYRMSIYQYYTPFNAFADIHNSTEWLEDTGIESTISECSKQDQELRRQRIMHAINCFNITYCVEMKKLLHPSFEMLQWWLDRHLKS